MLALAVTRPLVAWSGPALRPILYFVHPRTEHPICTSMVKSRAVTLWYYGEATGQIGNSGWSMAKGVSIERNAHLCWVTSARLGPLFLIRWTGPDYFVSIRDSQQPARLKCLSDGTCRETGYFGSGIRCRRSLCVHRKILRDLWGVLILGASRQSATSGQFGPLACRF